MRTTRSRAKWNRFDARVMHHQWALEFSEVCGRCFQHKVAYSVANCCSTKGHDRGRDKGGLRDLEGEYSCVSCVQRSNVNGNLNVYEVKLEIRFWKKERTLDVVKFGLRWLAVVSVFTHYLIMHYTIVTCQTNLKNKARYETASVIRPCNLYNLERSFKQKNFKFIQILPYSIYLLLLRVIGKPIETFVHKVMWIIQHSVVTKEIIYTLRFIKSVL